MLPVESRNMYTLLLRLGGPLQSWGSASFYDTRETDYMPTKSGCVGLIAAALGRRRDESVSDLNELSFGVRTDIAGVRINDFQTTQMGEKLNSNISNRVYLSDALFLAGFGCEDENFLEEIKEALINPAFSLFLGRRSCPPTMPVVLGIRHLDLYDALRDEPWLALEWRQNRLFGKDSRLALRIVIEDKEGNGAVKKDVPVSFSPFNRQYGYRCIKEMPPKIVVRASSENAAARTDPDHEAAAASGHDPFGELE